MTQEEADGIIEVLKRIINPESYHMPQSGTRAQTIIDLVSLFAKDTFLVDVKRSSSIDVQKYTIQLRCKREIILLRLDCGNYKHGNPDGSVIGCPHFHVFREGYGDKWAYPLPDAFTSPDSLITTLKEFLEYCHSVNIKDFMLQDQQGIGGMALEGNTP